MSELANDQYIHRLEENNAILQSQLKASQDDVSELTKANSLLREALEYYADEKNWWYEGSEFASSWRFDEDGYKVAQQALETEDGVKRHSLNKKEV